MEEHYMPVGKTRDIELISSASLGTLLQKEKIVEIISSANFFAAVYNPISRLSRGYVAGPVVLVWWDKHQRIHSDIINESGVVTETRDYSPIISQ